MAVFLDTSGNTSLGVAVCDRCRRKFPIGALKADPNSPGLMVCDADRDEYDPYRLAPRVTESITLPFVRREFDIATNPGGVISEDGDYFFITEEGDGWLIFDGED